MLFVFMPLFWVIDTVCLFHLLFCIMYSAFNQLIFLILCSHCLCLCKGLVLSGGIAKKIVIIIIIIIFPWPRGNDVRR